MHRRPCFTPPGRGRLRRPWVIYRGIRQRSPIRRDREVIYRESRPGQMRGALRHRPGRRWEPSAGGRARAFSASLCAGDAVRASGGRSWPSQSEAGAARTRFPRRPRNGWRHRANARPHNGWRLHASALRRLPKGGIFHPLVRAGEIVSGGTLLAEIVSPMTGEVMEEISAPVGGVVFFTCNKLMVTEHALLFRIVPRGLANA